MDSSNAWKWMKKRLVCIKKIDNFDSPLDFENCLVSVSREYCYVLTDTLRLVVLLNKNWAWVKRVNFSFIKYLLNLMDWYITFRRFFFLDFYLVS